MTQLYQLDRVHPRAPALPAHNLFHTVACQFGKLAAIHVGLGHCTRQALADPLLLGAAVGVGISSSVIPYVCDQFAMARLPRATPKRFRKRAPFGSRK